MHIHILSDLHLESGPYALPPDLECDVIVAAGDLAEGPMGVEWLKELGKPVIYVLGNHEYYSEQGMVDMTDRLAEIRAAAAGSNVYILENESVVIDGVRFLGATLWTNFGGLHHGVVAAASKAMLDYRSIGAAKWYAQQGNRDYFKDLYHRKTAHGSSEGERPESIDVDLVINSGKFHPIIAYQLHQQSLAWLQSTLTEHFDGETVVVTHHHPSYESLRLAGVDPSLFSDNARWPYDDRGLVPVAAYASNLDETLSNNRTRISLWASGHLHRHLDYMHEGVRVVCNPRGIARQRFTADSKKYLSLAGYPISDKKIEKLQAKYQQNLYQGNGIGFEPGFVVDLDEGLNPCVAQGVAHVRPSLENLHREVITLAPYIDHTDPVIAGAVHESLTSRASCFESTFDTMVQHVSNNLHADNRQFHGDLLRDMGMPGCDDIACSATPSEVRELICRQQAYLELLPQFSTAVRVVEKVAKQRALTLMRALLDANIDARLELPLIIVRPWRHIHAQIPFGWLLIKNGTEKVEDVVYSMVDQLFNRALRREFFVDVHSIAPHDTEHCVEFENAYSLATLEDVWREWSGPT